MGFVGTNDTANPEGLSEDKRRCSDSYSSCPLLYLSSTWPVSRYPLTALGLTHPKQNSERPSGEEGLFLEELRNVFEQRLECDGAADDVEDVGNAHIRVDGLCRRCVLKFPKLWHLTSWLKRTKANDGKQRKKRPERDQEKFAKGPSMVC